MSSQSSLILTDKTQVGFDPGFWRQQAFFFTNHPLTDKISQAILGGGMRVAIYCRVSTAQQDDEAQFHELLGLCSRCHWQVAGTYRETVSGLLGVDKRPELKKLLLHARQRQFEKVVVWSADRLGRSMIHLVNVLSDLKECNVHLFSYRQGVDTSSPMGAMLWQFLGIFSEFEHGIRRERQAAGIKRAKLRGVKFGRPRLAASKEREIVNLRRKGLAINKIARKLRVGTGSVLRSLHKEASLTEATTGPWKTESQDSTTNNAIIPMI